MSLRREWIGCISGLNHNMYDEMSAFIIARKQGLSILNKWRRVIV